MTSTSATERKEFVAFSGNVWHCTATVQGGYVSTMCGRERPLNDCVFSDRAFSARLCWMCRKITTRQMREKP